MPQTGKSLKVSRGQNKKDAEVQKIIDFLMRFEIADSELEDTLFIQEESINNVLNILSKLKEKQRRIDYFLLAMGIAIVSLCLYIFFT